MTCEHCHVDAGPTRREIMTRETLIQCLKPLSNQKHIPWIPQRMIAPEMNPDFQWFVIN